MLSKRFFQWIYILFCWNFLGKISIWSTNNFCWICGFIKIKRSNWKKCNFSVFFDKYGFRTAVLLNFELVFFILSSKIQVFSNILHLTFSIDFLRFLESMLFCGFHFHQRFPRRSWWDISFLKIVQQVKNSLKSCVLLKSTGPSNRLGRVLPLFSGNSSAFIFLSTINHWSVEPSFLSTRQRFRTRLWHKLCVFSLIYWIVNRLKTFSISEVHIFVQV